MQFFLFKNQYGLWEESFLSSFRYFVSVVLNINWKQADLSSFLQRIEQIRFFVRHINQFFFCLKERKKITSNEVLSHQIERIQKLHIWKEFFDYYKRNVWPHVIIPLNCCNRVRMRSFQYFFEFSPIIFLKVMKHMMNNTFLISFLFLRVQMIHPTHEPQTSRLTQNVQKRKIWWNVKEDDSVCYRWFVCHFNYIILALLKMKWKAKPIQLNEISVSVVCVCLAVHFSISLFFQPPNAKKNISTEGNSRDFKYVVCIYWRASGVQQNAFHFNLHVRWNDCSVVLKSCFFCHSLTQFVQNANRLNGFSDFSAENFYAKNPWKLEYTFNVNNCGRRTFKCVNKWHSDGNFLKLNYHLIWHFRSEQCQHSLWCDSKRFCILCTFIFWLIIIQKLITRSLDSVIC